MKTQWLAHEIREKWVPFFCADLASSSSPQSSPIIANYFKMFFLVVSSHRALYNIHWSPGVVWKNLIHFWRTSVEALRHLCPSHSDPLPILQFVKLLFTLTPRSFQSPPKNPEFLGPHETGGKYCDILTSPKMILPKSYKRGHVLAVLMVALSSTIFTPLPLLFPHPTDSLQFLQIYLSPQPHLIRN